MACRRLLVIDRLPKIAIHPLPRSDAFGRLNVSRNMMVPGVGVGPPGVGVFATPLPATLIGNSYTVGAHTGGAIWVQR